MEIWREQVIISAEHHPSTIDTDGYMVVQASDAAVIAATIHTAIVI